MNRIPSWARAAMKITAGALIAAFFAWSVVIVPREPAAPSTYGVGSAAYMINPGEMLLHAVSTRQPGTDNYRLPLLSVSAALIFVHAPPIIGRNWGRLSAVIALVLMMVLGGLSGGFLLESSVGPALLIEAFQLSPGVAPWHGVVFHEALFSLLVLTVACCFVLRVREPSPARSLSLGLALGASFLFRSTLVFFPPLIGAADLLARRLGRARPSAKSILLAVALPYLFLAPWVMMNAVVHRRFIPLEDGQANGLLVAGALGMVEKFDLKPSDMPSERIAAWVVKEIAKHPWRYVRGWARRACYVVMLQPVLFALAAFGLWRRRKDPSAWALAAVPGYMLALHGTMAVVPEYFDPVWPLLAALGARLIIKTREETARFAPFLLHAWLAIVLAACAFCEYVVIRYVVMLQAGLSAEASLERALKRDPNDDWLWFERGLRLLLDGRTHEAVGDLLHAQALRPDHRDREPILAWAFALEGSQEPLLAWARSLGENRDPLQSEPVDSDALLLQAHAALLFGDAGQSRAVLRRMLAEVCRADPSSNPFRSPVPSRAAACPNEHIAQRFHLWFSARPAAERLGLAKEMLDLTPENAGLWLEAGEAEISLGRKGAAADFIARARGLRLDRQGAERADELEKRIVSAQGESGIPREKNGIPLRRAAPPVLRCPEPWILMPRRAAAKFFQDKAVAEYGRGDSEAALKHLHWALRLYPRLWTTHLTLAYIELARNDAAGARLAYEQALSLEPRSAEDSCYRDIIRADLREIDSAR